MFFKDHHNNTATQQKRATSEEVRTPPTNSSKILIYEAIQSLNDLIRIRLFFTLWQNHQLN